MLVDTHMHIWKYPDHFNAERIAHTAATGPGVGTCTLEEYLAEAEGIVDKAIINGVAAWNTLGIHTSNDFLAEEVKKYPGKFAWMCVVIPTEKGAVEEVERCVTELGAVGLGEMASGYGEYRINDKRCYPVYEKAVELGVPLCIHGGYIYQGNVRLSNCNILDIDDIAIDFPELKIVINHMGWPKYEDACFLLQKHKNVFADVSCLARLSGLDRIVPGRPVVDFPYFHFLFPLLYYFSQTAGNWDPDKILWGTDWRATHVRESFEMMENLNDMLKKCNLPEIPQLSIDKILYENWKKVFKF